MRTEEKFRQQNATHRTLVSVSLIFATAIGALVVFFPRLLIPADVAILVRFQELRSPTLDSLVVALTQLGDPEVVWPLSIAIALYLALVAKSRPAALTWTLAIAFAATFNSLIKWLVGRSRPSELDYVGFSAFSFPSGHATVNLTLYGILAVLLFREIGPSRRWRATFLVTSVGAAIALSRLYLGAHWLSDVAASSFLAMAIVATAFRSYMPRRRHELDPGKLLAVAGLCLFVFGGLHIARNHGDDLARYGTARPAMGIAAPSPATPAPSDK